MKILSQIIIFLMFCFINTSIVRSQSTFEYLYKSPLDEISRSVVEDSQGNLYLTIENFQFGFLIKIDPFGNRIDSIKIYHPDNACNLSELVKVDNDQFIAIGSWGADDSSSLWFVKFDHELQILEDIKINTNGHLIFGFSHIIKHNENIVLLGHYHPENNMDVCLFEITTAGILVRSAYYNTDQVFNQGFALLEDIQDSTYKVFTYLPLHSETLLSFRMNRIDSNFNLIYFIGIPFSYLETPVSAEWIDDSTYILTGKLYNYELNNWDVGILKMTKADSILSSAYFGGNHTDEWPAMYDALDFISPDNIFFAGSSNTYFYPYQAEPSWIMLNILDADLSLKNQRFYGGDAYYLVNAILATQDSGCVLSCSRYDYTVQDEEFDVYILKVDQEGLLVSVPGEPVINEGICYLYPNPGKNLLVVNSARDGLKMELFDLTSQLTLSKAIQQGMNNVAVQGLAPGVYLYRIMDKPGNIIQSGKWIKMRE